MFVRWGKSSNGSPPKRRAGFAVAEFDWVVPALEDYLDEVRPLLAPAQHPAMWVTERGDRMSRRRLNRTFGLVRDLAGLPPELDLHALRHGFVTHLVEFDYPQKSYKTNVDTLGVVRQIHTGVSDEYRNRLVRRALHDRHSDLWDDQP